MARLRRLVLERLMRYYRFVSGLTADKPVQTVTSAQIAAALDTDPRKIGNTVAGYTVRSVRGMAPFVRRREIRLAILTTPVEVSQKVADRLVTVGVKAIWNFTPTGLTVPSGVLVRDEHISKGLCEIAHHLKGEGMGVNPDPS
ncbi:hypothetical protein ACFL5Q_00505 [Planctomycetota bacterium]